MATQRNRSRSRTEFVRALTDAGLSNFVVLDVDTAAEIFTEKRLELLETVRKDAPESVTALADSVGRNKTAVSRDLDLLFEHDLVEFHRDGSQKASRLKHESVFVEPII